MIYDVQTKEDLDKYFVEAGNKLVVIDFYANWCGPCKVITPKLEELSAQYANKALVLKVNVDECEEIAMEYNVTSMPTFVFMKENQVIDIFVGGNPEKLVNNVEKYVTEGVPVGANIEDGENVSTVQSVIADLEEALENQVND